MDGSVRLGRIRRAIAFALWLLCGSLLAVGTAFAAPYAAMVMDARTGKVIHSNNADTRLHPASLTKMMTLYVAFEAVRRGEISLDTMVRISAHAASEPPSKLGLRKGQKVRLRHLIRAAAVKSANDAATAIGEAVSGSEAAFARRMNRTAKALGMTRTTFKNAHGLTESGHLSTARDMTIMGRHLLYDYPDYYNLFSRITADAGIKKVSNTNRRFLQSYRGADGIKTGYTRAAGFNLVASAERGQERIIATVFGGRSTASRNAKVAELLDLGFNRAPSRVAIRKPEPPRYSPTGPELKGKTIRIVTAVKKSLRPQTRPRSAVPEAPVLVALQETIDSAVASVTAKPAQPAADATPEAVRAASTFAAAPAAAPQPPARPADLVAAAEPEPEPVPEVVTRMSSSGGRHWGVNVGRYTSRYKAERALLKVALQETSTLDGSLRKVINGKQGFDANFMGLTRETADLACRRLQARSVTCFMIGPS